MYMDEQVVDSRPLVVKITPPSIIVTKPTLKPLRTRVVVVHNNMVPVPIECFQPPDSGACGKDMIRVYYDHETRTCKPYSYTGCGGNANRFLSVKNCYRICHPYRYQSKPVQTEIRAAPVIVAPAPLIAKPRRMIKHTDVHTEYRPEGDDDLPIPIPVVVPAQNSFFGGARRRRVQPMLNYPEGKK